MMRDATRRRRARSFERALDIMREACVRRAGEDDDDARADRTGWMGAVLTLKPEPEGGREGESRRER